MAGRGLNDNEVQQEMNKMVSFIKQEALEKAREIKVKADEEFNIEKAKIVRQETVAIEAFFAKKTKQAEVQRKILQSTHINKARLRVLQQRQQYLNELFQEARVRLQSISKDKASYAVLLRDLLLQSFFKLMERNVTIQCRQADLDLVSKAAVEAKAAYEADPKIAKCPVPQLEISLDRENFISEAMTGGVVVHALDGRIRVDNTLEARLEQLNELMLPQIRLQLYGPSPNRRFFD